MPETCGCGNPKCVWSCREVKDGNYLDVALEKIHQDDKEILALLEKILDRLKKDGWRVRGENADQKRESVS